MKKIQTPRYNSITFLFLPFFIYFALNFSFVGTMFLKELVNYSSAIIPLIKDISIELDKGERAFEGFELKENDITPDDEVKSIYARDISRTFISIAIIILIFNLPIKYFFNRKRRGKKIHPFFVKYTKSLINFSPEIIGLIFLLSTVYIHKSLYTMLTTLSQDLSTYSLLRKILIISLFTSTLVLLLVYFGQKFRVQTKYIHHVFSKERLKRKPKGFNFPGLRGRFFITTIFLTFIPLIIVLFYVISSMNVAGDLSELSQGQIEFLFGDLLGLIRLLPAKESDVVTKELFAGTGYRYIDFFGLIQLFTGVIPGLFFSFIYILKIVTWSNASILKPIKELLHSMKNVEKGNLDSYTVVRSREETGQLASGFNQMLDGLKERDKIKSLFGQYLSAEISEEILKGNVDLSGSMYKATILFADIRGFTTLSEKISPHETISFLNEYYNVLIDVIHQYGGIIDKFMGDGILVLFGVPIASKDHADRAVAAAFTMQERLKEFNKSRLEKGDFVVRIGIGIHTGDVIAGNVGNSNKLEYTVIGDTVNVASRIENLTKKYETEMLIGESVYESLSTTNKNRERFQKLDGVTIRGKRLKVNLLKLTF